MSLTQINLGTDPNDGTGDDLRTAGGKINAAIAVADTALQSGDISVQGGGSYNNISVNTDTPNVFLLDLSTTITTNTIQSELTSDLLITCQSNHAPNQNAPALIIRGTDGLDGDGDTAAGHGTNVLITTDKGGSVVTGDGNGGVGGGVLIRPQFGGDNFAGVGDGGAGGDLYLDLTYAGGGAGHGGGVNGRNGQLIIDGLPNSDPSVSLAIWSDGGNLKKSGAPAGASGTFLSADAKTITVTNGVITDIA